jgi:hypothetical protein
MVRSLSAIVQEHKTDHSLTRCHLVFKPGILAALHCLCIVMACLIYLVKLIHLRMDVTVLDIKMLTLVEIYQYFEGTWSYHLLRWRNFFCSSAHCTSEGRVDFSWRCWEQANRKTFWNIIVGSNVKLGILFFSEIITGIYCIGWVREHKEKRPLGWGIMLPQNEPVNCCA